MHTRAGLQSSVGGVLIEQDCSPFSPLSGANQGGKEKTVTSASPSPAACTAHARRHGSASARRAGWAACVTEVSLIKLP